jgi:hypothetical protein
MLVLLFLCLIWRSKLVDKDRQQCPDAGSIELVCCVAICFPIDPILDLTIVAHSPVSMFESRSATTGGRQEESEEPRRG